MMRFQHNEVHFEVRYQDHKNAQKYVFFKLFDSLVTIICDIKIDLVMSEPPHYV